MKCGKVSSMTHFNPRTSQTIHHVSERLISLSKEIQPAHPFLAEIYQNLSYAIVPAVVDGPFMMTIPEHATAEVTEFVRKDSPEFRVNVYPRNFDKAKYWLRLRNAAGRRS